MVSSSVPIVVFVLPAGAVVVALWCLIALFAFYTLNMQSQGETWRNLDVPGGGIPVIGGAIKSVVNWVAGHLETAIVKTVARVEGWARAGLGPVADLIYRLATIPGELANAIHGAIADTAGAVERLASSLPGRINQFATEIVAARITDAYHALTAFATQAAAAAQHNAIARADALHDAALTSLSNVYADVLGRVTDVRREVIGLTQWATGAVDQVSRRTDQLFEDARRYTDTVHGGLFHTVQQLYEQSARATRELVGATAGELRGEMTAENARTAATAAVATAAVAATVSEFMRDCGRALCRNMGLKANLLDDVIELVELGMLFALIAHAMRDPAGAAREVRGMLDGPAGAVREIVSSIRDL